jgi:hypothetical protein
MTAAAKKTKEITGPPENSPSVQARRVGLVYWVIIPESVEVDSPFESGGILVDESPSLGVVPTIANKVECRGIATPE